MCLPKFVVRCLNCTYAGVALLPDQNTLCSGSVIVKLMRCMFCISVYYFNSYNLTYQQEQPCIIVM